MTLGENKKITLNLIEEYSKNNSKLTDDTDIQDRINALYSTAYQELSQYKKLVRTKILKEISEEDSTESGYDEINFPSNLYQFKKIVAWDKDGETVVPEYKTIGKKIYIKKSSNAQYILEYYAYPSIITEDTADDFSLELDQDVLMILPYHVANDILKVDPSADYTAFYAEYKRKLEQLDGSVNSNPSIIIEEGVL